MSSFDPIDAQQLSDSDLDQVSGGAGKPTGLATAGLSEANAKKVANGGKVASTGKKAPPKKNP